MKNLNIDFFGKRKMFFCISIGLLLIGVVCNIIFGAKLDIDFAGGAIIKYTVDGEVNADEVKSAITSATGRDVTVATNVLIATGENQITVNFSGNEALSIDDQQNIAVVLSETFENATFEVAESSSVDPVMGAKFFQKCLICFAITLALLLTYIAFRFKKIGGLAAGVTAVIALFHDVLIVYFTFIILGMNIDDIFIAVLLTIIGYSLNDTIVIYDRIRENKKVMGDRVSLPEIMNKSLNQTFMRSVYTSVTTFTVLLIVSIVSVVYGLTTVQNFAIPMMIGVLSGCYSSLFVASPLYTMWEIKQENKKQERKLAVENS